MTKPIIDHQGAYVTEPNIGDTVYSVSLSLGRKRLVIEAIDFQDSVGDKECILKGEGYATYEAAEMAITRIQCIQRLKVMAYGDGWLPKGVLGGHGVDFCAIPALDTVRFDDYDNSRRGYLSLTKEEKEAFAYIYKPEEDK